MRKHGVRIRLGEQPFQILAALIERPGELVTREELRELLWPGNTFVEFDDSLNSAVKKLRDALGDAARDPRYIETVPKRGYLFIATVKIVESDAVRGAAVRADETETVERENGAAATARADSAETAKSTPPAPAKQSDFRSLTTLAAALLIVLAAILWLRVSSTPPSGSSAEAGPLRFQARTIPGAHGWAAAISPDGKSVAYHDETDIHIAALDGGAPQRITDSTGRDRFPSWSPDGRRLAFTRYDPPEGGGLYVLSLVDSSVTRMGTVSTHPPAWTPDGKSLIGTNGKISITSLATREQQDLIAREDLKIDYRGAAVSPDGKTLAFGGCRLPDSCDLFVRSMEGGEPRRLTFQNDALSGLAWTPDSREVIYAMDGRMYRIPAWGGRQPGLLEFLYSDGMSGRVMFPSSARLAGNGMTRMTFVRYVRDVDIWVTDLRKEAGSPDSRRKLIDSPGIDHYPRFSPDGRKIAFYSDRPDGDRALWVSDSDGSNARQLTPSAFRVSDGAGPAWSPDGLQVAFRASTSADFASHIYTISVEGGLPQRVTVGDDESDPAWSRDGLYIYFQTNRSGQPEVWRALSDGRTPDGVPVNEMLSWSYQESPDGRYLYFCGAREGGKGFGSFWRVPVEGGEAEQILSPFSKRALSFRDEGLYFLDPGKKRSEDSLVALKLLDTETSQTTDVGRVVDPPSPRDFSLSPDGRLVLTSRDEPGTADLMLVEDFR